MEHIKFESNEGKNKDGKDILLEETVVRKVGNKEESLLRRAVGMPAFGSESEKKEYMAAHEEDALPLQAKQEKEDKEDFVKTLRRDLQKILQEDKGQPYLEKIIRLYLAVGPHILERSVTLVIKPAYDGFSLSIEHPQYGSMRFEF